MKLLFPLLQVKALLQKQVTTLDDEMRRLTVAISSANKHLEFIRGKLQDQVLLFEGGLKQTAASKLRTQEKQVEENVLKLKVHHFEKAIEKQEDNIYNLQKFRLDLETVRSSSVS